MFTEGYKYFGFNVTPDGTITYREWAPNAETASLVGDFSESFDKNNNCGNRFSDNDETTDNWDINAHPMKKNEQGVFEITLEPDNSNRPRIPHNSKVKVRRRIDKS